MPYIDNAPHAGSAEILTTGMYDEPAGTIARTIPRTALQGAAVAGGTTGQFTINVPQGALG